MSGYKDLIAKSAKVIDEAIQYDDTGQFEAALSSYMIALDYLKLALDRAPKGVQDHIKPRMRTYIGRAEDLQVIVAREKEQARANLMAKTPSSAARPSAATSGGNGNGSQQENFKDNMTKAMMGTRPETRLKDVAGLVEAKEALTDAVLMPIQAPHLYKKGENSWSGILLYGPPGTGKSFLASAIAGEAKCAFYSITSSDLVSKWVGQSEQQIKALFESARENKPAIIFIDEVESMLAERSQDSSSGGNGHQDRVVAELISQLDGVGKDNTGILFLCATNFPWKIDTAGIRRTQKRIYIPLPDEEARAQMLNKAFKDDPSVGQETIDDLIALTHGYSGADIKIFLIEVSAMPRRRISKATHFKGVNQKGESTLVFYPCEPNDPDGIKCTFANFQQKELLRLPKLTHDDYIECLKRTRPTVDQDALKRYEEWTDKFGIQ